MSTQARARTQELRKAQREAALRQARRRRTFTLVGGLVIVALLAGIVVAVLKATGGEEAPPAATGELVTPQNLSPSGAIPVGEPGAPVTVEIYFDYMCPACGAFEAANGAELDQLLEDGVARIELRPISFLDEQSNGTEYSTRAANAIAAVADAAPERVWAFHAALYAEQPAEGTDGLSDDQLAEIATEAGVPGDVVDGFRDGTFRSWVALVTQQAFDSGVQSTPTVKIDGVVFEGDRYTTGPLTEAIDSAAAE